MTGLLTAQIGAILKYVREIEAKTTLPLHVIKNDSTMPRDCKVGSLPGELEVAAFVMLRGQAATRAEALHELLHIWRWIAKGIPVFTHLNEGDEDAAAVAQNFENSIEHSEICPIQVQEGYTDDVAFWEAAVIREIERHFAPPKASDAQIRALMITSVLEMRRFGVDAQSRIKNIYKAAGLKSQFRGIQSVLAALTAQDALQKAALSKMMVRRFGFPARRLCLRRTGTMEVVEVI